MAISDVASDLNYKTDFIDLEKDNQSPFWWSPAYSRPANTLHFTKGIQSSCSKPKSAFY